MSATESLPGRSPEEILADWRAAEAAVTDTPDPDLESRIERLKAEHAEAVRARSTEARQLGSAPSQPEKGVSSA